MLTVTFYSYKGGVGRTMALLNVAARLVALSKKVVLLDLDLEAPGLGHAHTTRHASGGELVVGASDFIFDRLEGKELPLHHYVYPVQLWEGEAQVMGAGTRAAELSRKVARIINTKEFPEHSEQIFEHLLAKIEQDIEPDYVLIDSRTGRADIAGVCTMELPDVLVACCGLSEQNITGMGEALDTIWKYHDEEGLVVPTLLALGPVPDLRDEMVEREGLPRRMELLSQRVGHKVTERWSKTYKLFPELTPVDCIHLIPHDAWAVFEEELVDAPGRPIDEAYRKLTMSLRRAADEQGLRQTVPAQQLSVGSESDGQWLGKVLSRQQEERQASSGMRDTARLAEGRSQIPLPWPTTNSTTEPIERLLARLPRKMGS